MDPVSNACTELFELTSERQASPGRLLVALSGGLDSVVLLHAVAAAASGAGQLHRVRAVHVDHGLHPDSGSWAAQCRQQAEALGVGIEVHRLELASGSNLEARARTARYHIFESLLDDEDTLLLAHHGGDQLESQLLHLFQGRGLYGMPDQRRLGAGWLRRPLLQLPQAALRGYARSHELSWQEDPSNADQQLDRNFLRHSLLPLLGNRFPALPKRIDQVRENLSDMTSALDELAGLDRQPLPMSVFDGLSQSARIALLRRWLTRHASAGGISRAALQEFLRQLDAGNDRYPSLALPSGQLVRYRRALHLAPLPPDDLASSYPLAIPGELVLPHGVLSVALADTVADGPTDGASSVQLDPPLRVLFAAEGQRLQVGGHERNVRDLLRAAGVPPWLRGTLPLIADQRGLAVIPGIAGRDAEPGEGMQVVVRWRPEEGKAR